ncbi:hypothetical protein ACFR9U_15970 [Halorientalis brevis]|uniref:Restriction endonuclease n=1 Tax=Halorientalis brevis TaxID=1126241 RepID=A0ABD6CGY4_9EURY|nr:hypothetical protein [Halorientalis brevis]
MHIGNSGGGGGTAGGGGACSSVAESDKHAKWKSLAADQLEHVFAGQIDHCEMEYRLDAPRTEKQRRDADAAIVFESPDQQLGKGVIIEVQHKNESKDKRGTAQDYYAQGFATVWATEADFAADRCRLTEADIRKRARDAVWPWAVPERVAWPEYEFCIDDPLAKIGLRDFVEVDDEPVGQVPATLPPDWNDDVALWLWRSRTWKSLFDESEDYTDIWPYAKVPATLPPEWYDEQAGRLWRETDWLKIVHGTGEGRHDGKERIRAQSYIDRVRGDGAAQVEIDFAPLIGEDQWRLWWRAGRGLQRERDVSVERPQTPFDDVQCHECGHYMPAANADRRCQNCDELYDWLWNIETGRISESAVPAEISLIDL